MFCYLYIYINPLVTRWWDVAGWLKGPNSHRKPMGGHHRKVEQIRFCSKKQLWHSDRSYWSGYISHLGTCDRSLWPLSVESSSRPFSAAMAVAHNWIVVWETAGQNKIKENYCQLSQKNTGSCPKINLFQNKGSWKTQEGKSISTFPGNFSWKKDECPSGYPLDLL